MKRRNILLCSILLLLVYYLFQIYNKNDINNDINNNDIIFNDQVLYIENFLSEKDYQKILELDTDKRGFKNENFRYIKPLNNPDVTNIFYNEKYINKLKKRLKNTMIYESKFPIEQRIYPNGSKGMNWHIDTLMYDKPQYEAVYTIRNNTDSLTEWIDDNNKIHSVWTKPNSIMIVKAQGYKHHVTPVNDGEREILKLIYTQSDNINNNYRREMERFRYLGLK